MKATKDHISFETAKLLKDCGVTSKLFFCYKSADVPVGLYDILDFHESQLRDRENKNNQISCRMAFAYTWQEILWENAEKFFGKDLGSNYEYNHTEFILSYLQQKKYDEADLYFRDKCILIKKI